MCILKMEWDEKCASGQTYPSFYEGQTSRGMCQKPIALLCSSLELPNGKRNTKGKVSLHGFLRKMVKGGFTRQNALKHKDNITIPTEEINWAYKITR